MPLTVILEGDKVKAAALRGPALSQLRILHNQMSFQDLKQDIRMVSFGDGSYMKVESNWGLDKATIFVPSPPTLVPVSVPVEAKEVFIGLEKDQVSSNESIKVWAYGGIPPYTFSLNVEATGQLLSTVTTRDYERIQYQAGSPDSPSTDVIIVKDSIGSVNSQSIYTDVAKGWWSPKLTLGRVWCTYPAPSSGCTSASLTFQRSDLSIWNYPQFDPATTTIVVTAFKTRIVYRHLGTEVVYSGMIGGNSCPETIIYFEGYYGYVDCVLGFEEISQPENWQLWESGGMNFSVSLVSPGVEASEISLCSGTPDYMACEIYGRCWIEPKG